MKRRRGRDGESKGRRKAMDSMEKRETGRKRRLRIGKSETGNTERQNIRLSSARNVAMNTSGGTFNTELKLAEMALLLL